MKERKYVDQDKAFVVHPDITEAFTSYDGSPDHFKKTFDHRDQLISDGEYYWNTDHDVEMTETAEIRSKQPGWEYPGKKK
jgi:hypothetical protein